MRPMVRIDDNTCHDVRQASAKGRPAQGPGPLCPSSRRLSPVPASCGRDLFVLGRVAPRGPFPARAARSAGPWPSVREGPSTRMGRWIADLAIVGHHHAYPGAGLCSGAGGSCYLSELDCRWSQRALRRTLTRGRVMGYPEDVIRRAVSSSPRWGACGLGTPLSTRHT